MRFKTSLVLKLEVGHLIVNNNNWVALETGGTSIHILSQEPLHT